MDERHLQHRLTTEERNQFERDGFFVVREALDKDAVERLVDATDRLVECERPKYARNGLKPHQPLNVLDFMGRDEEFLPLIDWPKTFMRVVDILGWHIQLYHSHIIVTPPLPHEIDKTERRLGWHQDSGRLNIDIESTPRPRISLKVGFFITDVSKEGRGNFHVIPGSHLQNQLKPTGDGNVNPAGAKPIFVNAGDAVFFDRRLWHAAGMNYSKITRKALFYGYSYRWLKPRDNMTVAHYMDKSDDVRKQLLGASPNGGFGFTSPTDEDVPLKTWLEKHLGTKAIVP